MAVVEDGAEDEGRLLHRRPLSLYYFLLLTPMSAAFVPRHLLPTTTRSSTSRTLLLRSEHAEVLADSHNLVRGDFHDDGLVAGD